MCATSVWSQVGVKIDRSSFSLTRIVTFVPFYMLVNRTKHSVFVCEVGQDIWKEAGPEQVKAKPVSLHNSYEDSAVFRDVSDIMAATNTTRVPDSWFWLLLISSTIVRFVLFIIYILSISFHFLI